jgi:hypothetical protein
MEKGSTIRDRVLGVLEGRKPDRIPFIDRMDFWYRGMRIQGKVPEPFRGMSLPEIHRKIGFGQEDWFSPCAFKGARSSTSMSRKSASSRTCGG